MNTHKAGGGRVLSGWMGMALALVLTLGTGCQSGTPPTTTAPTIPLKLGDQTVQVEVADSPEESRQGLMDRKSMPEDRGMLFVFSEPRRAGFWMRNTLIPLSIGFFDADGVLLEIYEMQPLDETTVTSRSRVVKYALEMNRGWFDRHGIKPGLRVEMPVPAAVP